MGEASSDVLAALERIYASLPGIDCRRLCHTACGPIVLTGLEADRIASVAGRREADADLVCPYLERESGLCGVYPLRPLICRLWGVTESLPCQWGCEPERVLSDVEVGALIEDVLELAGGEVATVWPGWASMLRSAERPGG
ncbi:MAG: YkgJ family cysteine cluster protein [Dehalococcoidia bacterium]